MKHLFKFLLVGLTLLPEIMTAQTPYIRQGILDLKNWDFNNKGSFALSGEWEFFMSELITPQEFSKRLKPPHDYIEFPSLWNDHNKSLKPGNGFATYRLRVVVNSPISLALELPHFYSNYNLWINSNLTASNGKVGKTENLSEPQWRPQTVRYSAETDTIDLVLQISNFHHAKGGVREPVLLGTNEHLNLKREVAITSNIVLFITLMIIGLVCIFLFLFSKTEKSLLYLSGLCVTWAIRSLFSNEYPVNSYYPDFPWEICVKIEYITLYLMMITAILFLASIFKTEVNAIFKYFFCGCNVIFILITLIFNASVYTQFLPVYLSFAGALLLYSIYVLIRALVYERAGVWLMISCFFLGIVLFSYDLISYEGFATFNPIIINFGYFIIFVLMTICLLYKLGYMKRSAGNANILTYEDLYGTPKKEVKR